MVKRTILVALALLSLAASAFAQEDPESDFATIFRGKLPATYPFRHNGTYYWDQKAFQQGDVWYNGRLYRDIFLNVDAVSGELQARPVDGVIAVVLVADQVAWFTMGDKPFVNLRYLGWPEAPEGYFEVVRDGETPLLRRVSKTLRTDSNGSSYAIGYEDPDYDYSTNNYFLIQETFYVLEQGKLKRISRRNLAQRGKTVFRKVAEMAEYAREEINAVGGYYAYGREPGPRRGPGRLAFPYGQGAQRAGGRGESSGLRYRSPGRLFR